MTSIIFFVLIYGTPVAVGLHMLSMPFMAISLLSIYLVSINNGHDLIGRQFGLDISRGKAFQSMDEEQQSIANRYIWITAFIRCAAVAAIYFISTLFS